MDQPETKYIVEVRKNYSRDIDNQFTGGEWEFLKDNFGNEQLFDFYFEAYRILKEKCPAVEVFGQNVGRVKEVVMTRKLK